MQVGNCVFLSLHRDGYDPGNVNARFDWVSVLDAVMTYYTMFALSEFSTSILLILQDESSRLRRENQRLDRSPKAFQDELALPYRQ